MSYNKCLLYIIVMVNVLIIEEELKENNILNILFRFK